MKKNGLKFLHALLFLLSAGVTLLPICYIVTRVNAGDYYRILLEELWFYPKFWYSILVALVIACGALFISFTAGVSLRLCRMKGKGVILLCLLLLMLMPLQVTLLPNYIALRDMNLLNTAAALILPMIFSPFSVFLMYQYAQTIDFEGLEAARLETGSAVLIMGRVILPQMRACAAAVFVFMFAEGFNMVEQPMYFVKAERLKPLSLLRESLAEEDAGLVYAVGVICLIPFLLLYVNFEEEIWEGMGTVKW